MEQGQHFEGISVDIAFGEGDQDCVQRAFIEQMEQGVVRAHRQVHLQVRTAQLHPHNQPRDGFHRQRVKRTDAQAALSYPGDFA